jgi:glycosyltransferase involved in cell wall biosynthesis
MTPTVSVVIPTFNRANFLERAVRSVLSQMYRDFEIIIVDDASTDNIQEMLNEKFKQEIDAGVLRHVKNEKNIERSRSRNKGMDLARGEYIALLDDDDVWLPYHLEQTVNFLENNNNVGCVFSNFIMIPEFDLKNIRVRFNDIVSDRYTDLCIVGELGATPTAVFRRNIYKRLGGFNEFIHYLEDREFFSRISMNCKIGFIAEPTVCTYRHSGSYSRPSPEQKENVWNIIEGNAKKYNFHLRNELIEKSYLNISWSFLPNIPKAKEYFYKAMKLDWKLLFNINNIKLFIRLLLGQKIYLLLKKIRSNE